MNFNDNDFSYIDTYPEENINIGQSILSILNFDTTLLNKNPYVIIEIEFVDGSKIQTRAFIKIDYKENFIEITIENLPFNINASDIKEIYYYGECDYSFQTCKNYFNNINRFHGFPNLEYKYPYVKK